MNRELGLEIYVDVDGTLYDLNKLIVETYNKETNSNINSDDTTDWWWSHLKKVNREYFRELLKRKGITKEGKAMKDCWYYLSQLYYEGYKIKIITAPNYENEYFLSERIEWLESIFSWFNPEEHLILTTDKSVCAKSNRILIDDSIINLKTFSKEGGISICYTQGWNKEYNGLRCDNWEQVYKLIHTIDSK